MKTLLDLTTRQRHWLSSRLMHPEGSYALSIVDAQAIQISQIKEVLALYRECPRQYPCIPGWHVDNVPRAEDGRQLYDKVRLDLPMWMWVSGGPLTQFRTGYVLPEKWVRFTQADEHRGAMATEFCWRGFVRGTHKDIMPPKSGNHLRRHCQVYVGEKNYQW